MLRVDSNIARGQVAGLITSYCLSQAIHTVAALGIADLLTDGPRNADRLAEAAGCSASHLARLMRALCAVGLFAERDGSFQLTALSRCLCKGPESLRPMAMFHGEEMYRAFGGLVDNVRTGEPAWNAAFGTSVWEYFHRHPERSALFDQVMSANHADDVSAMVRACGFSQGGVVVDVGGGDGSLLREILNQNPSVNGILLEQPSVVARATRDPQWQGLLARCEFVGGDFFADIPAGADCYVFRHVLHDWDDESCLRLLERCRRVMSESGRIVVIEAIIGRQGAVARWSDLGLMVLGGQERDQEEFLRLLRTAGFGNARVIASPARVSLLEGRVA
jgi:hypothetical protein